MNQIENRVEGILEPDLIDWNSGSDLDLDLDVDHFIDFIQTFLENEMEGFIEDNNEDPVDAEYAKGNIICADEIGLISAD